MSCRFVLSLHVLVEKKCMQHRRGSGNLSLQAAVRLNKLSALTPALLVPSSAYILQVCVMCDRTVTGIKPTWHESSDCGEKGAMDRQGNRGGEGEGREMRWVFIGMMAHPGGETAGWQGWSWSGRKNAAPAARACLSAVFVVFGER